MKKYNVKVFTKENEISFYLLGVFITDGCVKKDRVSLSSKDKDWIEQIKNLISPEIKLLKDGENCFRINIFNKQIKDWLIKYNCVPNKSLTVKFPNVPIKYLPDFIRGCIDGDGSISNKQYIRKSNNKPFKSINYTLTSASKDFVEGFANALKQLNINYSIRTMLPGTYKGNINGRTILHKNIIYTITGGHNSAFKLLKFAYYPKHKISLQRKKILAEQIIKNYTL